MAPIPKDIWFRFTSAPLTSLACTIYNNKTSETSDRLPPSSLRNLPRWLLHGNQIHHLDACYINKCHQLHTRCKSENEQEVVNNEWPAFGAHHCSPHENTGWYICSISTRWSLFLLNNNVFISLKGYHHQGFNKNQNTEENKSNKSLWKLSSPSITFDCCHPYSNLSPHTHSTHTFASLSPLIWDHHAPVRGFLWGQQFWLVFP